jgi:type II secretory pathway predicted ATPase ExeA
MFLEFYGLREQPFGVTPDPRFLYLSAAHRAALASLEDGIESGCGLLALIAQPGMGKTTLLFQLLQKFGGTARTALLCQTQCNSQEFLRFLHAELRSEGDGQGAVRPHDGLTEILLREARAGRRVIVVVDEAQNLDRSVLETIRLLSGFETPRAKLLQIVLAGQPQLADTLASQELSQLRQRISLLKGLPPLSLGETRNYIAHRLHLAGYAGAPLFTPEAILAIAQFAEGTPRTINNVCFNALSLSCGLRQRVVGVAAVEEVISDLDVARHGTAAPSASPFDRRLDGVVAANAFPAPDSSAAAAENPAENPGYDALTPEEAKAYIQQFVWRLRVRKRRRCRTPARPFWSPDRETFRPGGFNSGDRQ